MTLLPSPVRDRAMALIIPMNLFRWQKWSGGRFCSLCNKPGGTSQPLRASLELVGLRSIANCESTAAIFPGFEKHYDRLRYRRGILFDLFKSKVSLSN